MDPAIFDPELTELADQLFVNLYFRRLLTRLSVAAISPC
jgi:hypothetical protein